MGEFTMRRLFIDIETSLAPALIFRPGYNINVGYKNLIGEAGIICIAWKWQHKPVKVMTWNRKQCDRAMIERIIPVINDADEVVAHNGRKFDLPWIRARALYHGLDLPVCRMVDTLSWARRYFRFSSNRLDYLGQFLKIGQKTEHTGFDMWKDVYFGDRKALKLMAEYCKNDVAGLLQPVWEKMSTTCPADTHAGAVAHREKWSCPRCASEDVKQHQRKFTGKGTPQFQMQCKACGGYFTISERVQRAYKEETKSA